MTDFPRGRYDSDAFVRLFDAAPVTRDGAEACLVLDVGPEPFTLYFPSCPGDPTPELLAVARSLCAHIGRLDDGVQVSCEADAARTGLDPKRSVLSLAYAGRRAAVRAPRVHFGVFVNTQWTAVFEVDDDGRWTAVNV